MGLAERVGLAERSASGLGGETSVGIDPAGETSVTQWVCPVKPSETQVVDGFHRRIDRRSLKNRSSTGMEWSPPEVSPQLGQARQENGGGG